MAMCVPVWAVAGVYLLGLSSHLGTGPPDHLCGSAFLGSGLHGGVSKGLCLPGPLVTLELAVGMPGSVCRSHGLTLSQERS